MFQVPGSGFRARFEQDFGSEILLETGILNIATALEGRGFRAQAEIEKPKFCSCSTEILCT